MMVVFAATTIIFGCMFMAACLIVVEQRHEIETVQKKLDEKEKELARSRGFQQVNRVFNSWN